MLFIFFVQLYISCYNDNDAIEAKHFNTCVDDTDSDCITEIIVTDCNYEYNYDVIVAGMNINDKYDHGEAHTTLT